MKTNLHTTIRAGLALILVFSLQLSAFSQGTAFTYQGRLDSAGAPFTGSAEFQPTLWDAESAGSQVAANTPSPLIVSVTNGLFVLPLDFEAAPFQAGLDRWLQLEVRTAIGPFTTLSPRQKLTPTPYALTAGNLSGTLPASQLSGTVADARLSANVSVLGQSIESAEITDGTIVNADLSPSAAIADTKLATIASAGKVANTATTAASANTANAIVARDAAGNFTAGTVTAAFAGNAAGLTNLNASQLTSGTIPDARLADNVLRTNQVWLVSGNTGTIAGTHFVGTTDNQPLELRVNNSRGLRLEPTPDDIDHSNIVNVIAGSAVNIVGPGVYGATIGGGGAVSYLGEPRTNRVNADFGTIGGGHFNTIQVGASDSTIGGGNGNTIELIASDSTIGGGSGNTIQRGAGASSIGGGVGNLIETNAYDSTIGGGGFNSIRTNATYSTIGGGSGNTIQSSAKYATIGGGGVNSIRTNATYSTIGGGYSNTIETNAQYATLGGGYNNTIQTNAQHATIPGGRANSATNYAFAAGYRAKANHTGAFVWGDSNNSDIASTNANSVTMRAAGGYRLFSNSGASVGAYLAAGGGSWTSMSDRTAKEDFQPVDPLDVLGKVAALPLTTWKYKSQGASVRHIGPVAQDFKAAFGVGETDTGITSIDADGVALAAIQGLNQKVESGSQRAEGRMDKLEAENAELKARLEKLQQLLNHRLNGGVK